MTFAAFMADMFALLAVLAGFAFPALFALAFLMTFVPVLVIDLDEGARRSHSQGRNLESLSRRAG